jgi:hypothetical protein
MLCVLSGCAKSGELAIRAKPTGLAAGERPASLRVAEARGQFALGNVALALEGFRKALREEPGSTDAMNGIAACYDRMGRFDLSRRYYEMALAVAPGDFRLYANLALSLEMQGRTQEAAEVRAEALSRSGRQEIPGGAAAQVSRAGVSIGARNSVEAMPIPRPAPPDAETSLSIVAHRSSMIEAAASVSIALPPAEPAPGRQSSVRLERLSLGEVALVTSGPLRWTPIVSERLDPAMLAAKARARSSTAAALTLLNAARSQGLAARTRALLQRGGLRQIAIGDAPQVQRSSFIAYPSSRRAEAAMIASQLGLPLRHKPGTGQRLVVYLGRDAAAALPASRP